EHSHILAAAMRTGGADVRRGTHPGSRRGSHWLLELQHELVHRLVGRRLYREIAGVFRVAPEVALAYELEPSRLDLATQRRLLDEMKGLADRRPISRTC